MLHRTLCNKCRQDLGMFMINWTTDVWACPREGVSLASKRFVHEQMPTPPAGCLKMLEHAVLDGRAYDA